MNLKELMNKIVDFGLKNKLINTSVGCSSLYQINFEDIEDYPLLVFQPSSPHRVTQNFVEYTITLYWIDRLNSDNSNEFDIFSTSVENLKGIIKGMRNIKGIVDVSTDFDIVNFTDTQRLSDKCAGAYVTLKIDVLNENSCSLSNLEEEENEIKLKNQIKYIKIDRNGEYIITYDEGYNGLKEVEIDVELDTSFYVEEGYNQGKNVGIEEGKQLQKDLLEPITITENGTYNRENGYSEIVVEVPDLNGDYDTGYNEGYNVGDVEGYDRGKTDGYNEGYNVGYDEGEENGVAQAGEIIAQTARVLDITENGTYVSQYSDPIYPDAIPEGNLIKTVNVNVQPKVNVAEMGIKFGYSTLKEIPEIFDFNGITDMNNMFEGCNSLQTIPLIDTSNVTNMDRTFYNCSSLTSISQLNTSNVTNMNSMFYNCSSLITIPWLDTSNVTNMNNLFYNCGSLQTIPELNTRKVRNMSYMFQIYSVNNTLISLPKIYCDSCTSLRGYFYADKNNLTDVGGWINLNCNWDDNYGLAKCPNLTYQSCINILNGLADVTELGGRTLKVHPNFLTAVGDEISIGVNKGWTITT